MRPPVSLMFTVFLVVLSPHESAHATSQATTNGFSVKLEATIDATPARTYDILVQKVGSWWDSAHTFSGDAKNMSIDARPGGCFCEKLSNRGFVEHLRVVYAAPGESLRLTGALGPLQSSGLSGSMTWTLTNTNGRTGVELTYSVGGFMEGGFDEIAPAVEMVLGQQLQRLKCFVETGNAAPQTRE